MSARSGEAMVAKPVNAKLGNAGAGKWRRTIFRCGISLTFLAVPAVITIVLRFHPDLSPIISLAFVMTVAAAAWWGGIWAGVLVTFATIPVLTLSASLGKVLLPDHLDPLGIVLLIFLSVLVASVAKSRRRVEEVLRQANDVLEARVAERTAELLGARNWFETTLASIGDAVIATDMAGEITFMNGVAQSLTGWTSEEARGKPLSEVFAIVNEETRKTADNPVSTVLRTGTTCGLANHTVLLARNGREVPIDDSAAPILDHQNKAAGVVLIFRDITQRRRDEKIAELGRIALEQSNQELQQFAFAASHDLQEPLRNVKIYSQLLGQRYRGKLDADADQFIDFAVNSAARMEVLLSDLLAYTQASATTDGQNGRADAKTALENIIENLHASVTETGASICYGDLPVVAMNDVHLQQVFQNLIGNAIKYRGDRVPQIHVSAERAGPDWVFGVKDNGIGIDAQYQQRIFGLFKRLHTQDKYAGSGIGLALCQKIVQRYGGRIWVESEPGVGSTFFFTCPRDGV